MSPPFSPAVTEYTATTSNATNTITATAGESSTVSVAVNGTALTNGTAATWQDSENAVVITATAGKASKVYKVTVTKET